MGKKAILTGLASILLVAGCSKKIDLNGEVVDMHGYAPYKGIVALDIWADPNRVNNEELDLLYHEKNNIRAILETGHVYLPFKKGDEVYFELEDGFRKTGRKNNLGEPTYFIDVPAHGKLIVYNPKSERDSN